MEIPSSSPIYSPLKSNTDTYNLQDSDQVCLFPHESTQDLPETQDVAAPASISTNPSIQHHQNTTETCAGINDSDNNDIHSIYDERGSALDQNRHDYLYSSAHYSDHPPSDITLDPEVTIYSDSEYEVPDTESSDTEFAPEKGSTQSYLDALLTDSVLESLPLPLESKESIRKKYGDRKAPPPQAHS